MSSVWIIRRSAQARGANRTYATRTRSRRIASRIVNGRGVVDDRALMARDGLRAGNVWRRSRHAGVYLWVGWIRARESSSRVQASTINWDVDIVLRSAIVIDLAQDTRRWIDGTQSVAQRWTEWQRRHNRQAVRGIGPSHQTRNSDEGNIGEPGIAIDDTDNLVLRVISEFVPPEISAARVGKRTSVRGLNAASDPGSIAIWVQVGNGIGIANLAIVVGRQSSRDNGDDVGLAPSRQVT